MPSGPSSVPAPVAPPRPLAVERARRFIVDPGGDRFDDAALAVFAHQFTACAPFRRYCRRRGVSPESVTSWDRIPPVPAAAFRSAVLSTAPAAHVFATSGTTGGREARGRHHLPELALYDASWPEPFRTHVLPDRASIRILSLVPAWSAAPESSLSFMVGRVMSTFGGEKSATFIDRSGLDGAGVVRALAGAEGDGDPVLVIGTFFALAAVLDALDGEGRRFRLPAGSRIMDTGGMKGKRREVSRAALLGRYRDLLGVPAIHVIGEYGMTELSSQFYEVGTARDREGTLGSRPRRFAGPRWTRTLALDPETLRPVGNGRPGLLAHWDLANAWTVLAVLTEDLGVTDGKTFELHGRAEGGALRGCSLAAEEILDGT